MKEGEKMWASEREDLKAKVRKYKERVRVMKKDLKIMERSNHLS